MKDQTKAAPPPDSMDAVAIDDTIRGRSANFSPQTVAEMLEFERSQHVEMSFSDRIADKITAFAGSNPYVWLHVVWFTAWIVLNEAGFDFDPFPFGLLTMIVSLEAIFLSTFVLISQNHQASIADKRSKIDTQINLLSEREVTKLMDMVAQIYEAMNLGSADDEVDAMRKPTHVRELAHTVDALETHVNKSSDKGPSSAAETEA